MELALIKLAVFLQSSLINILWLALAVTWISATYIVSDIEGWVWGLGVFVGGFIACAILFIVGRIIIKVLTGHFMTLFIK